MGEKMKVVLVSKNTVSLCTMKGCEKRKVHEIKHYLQLDVQYNHVEEKINHEMNDSQTGMIKSIELNIRKRPLVKAEIMGQLFKGDKITILAREGAWVHVQHNEIRGWTFLDCVETFEEMQQKEQRIGEKHHVLICEDCLQKLNWKEFYETQIEPNQEQHVVGNYMIECAEAAVALESEMQGKEMSSEAVKNLLLEEIDSGVHGNPNRFNKEKIISHYVYKHAF